MTNVVCATKYTIFEAGGRKIIFEGRHRLETPAPPPPKPPFRWLQPDKKGNHLLFFFLRHPSAYSSRPETGVAELWGKNWDTDVDTRSSPWLVDPNCANKQSTQSKAHYTSSDCKVLGVISKTVTFAENLAFWGAAWVPVRTLHPLWQGEGKFLNKPQLTSASGYKHY